MTLAVIYSRAYSGITAPLITVEIHISRGMPGLQIVGLAETTVKESKDRVRSALLNVGLEFPRRRITINLAPADLPKEGGRFDLPIALGILAASGQIPTDRLEEFEFIGELALTGNLRPVSGILPAVLAAKEHRKTLIVPLQNSQEAGLVDQVRVLGAEHLLQVCTFLKEETQLAECRLNSIELNTVIAKADLLDVKGQSYAKKALEIAAAGRHSLLLTGPPGTGKTMLASRLTTILPDLTEEQALSVASLQSVSARGFDSKTWRMIPFRSPHHTSSAIALVGGGRPPRPGEISLAHQGVLFLDELPEFNRQVLETLREPLESGSITISRAGYQMHFPAQFQLIAAMNPCPCGYWGSQQECYCTVEQIQRYFAKLSGPLLDRIDMQVQMRAVSSEILWHQKEIADSSLTVKARVIEAQNYQMNRQGKINSELLSKEIEKYCFLEDKAQQLLRKMAQQFYLSARSCHRILKLARTIADLNKSDVILSAHVSEALLFRSLERNKKSPMPAY